MAIDPTIQRQLEEHFHSLPPVIQRAISSSDIEKHLRDMVALHKLHVDQWDDLQNEVIFTLLGFQEPAALPEHLTERLHLSKEAGTNLATAINDEIFEPIREELERALTHPEAKDAQVSDMEKARLAAIALAKAAGEDVSPVKPAADIPPTTPTPAPQPAVVPATPPAPKPEGQATRAPVSETYKPAQPSTERKDVASDPYRESPL